MLRSTMASSPRKLHVGIVGAGFAGLRCADVLLQHGHQVTIYEARNRLGGRVCVHRSLIHSGTATAEAALLIDRLANMMLTTFQGCAE